MEPVGALALPDPVGVEGLDWAETEELLTDPVELEQVPN